MMPKVSTLPEVIGWIDEVIVEAFGEVENPTKIPAPGVEASDSIRRTS